MAQVPLSEFKKIVHFDQEQIPHSDIVCMTFFVGGEWEFWVPLGDELRKLKAWPAESLYFAAEPELPTDGYLHFLDFLVQRACRPPIRKPLSGFIDDIYNLGAIQKKFEIIFEYSKTNSRGVERLVITELEYLVALCRSIFDLLQEIISAQWKAVKLLNPKGHKYELPKSFSDIVIKGSRITTDQEIRMKYNIPKELVDFYTQVAPFFSLLKTFRDGIIHHGQTTQQIYVTERGFAVSNNSHPFSEFKIWNTEHQLPNNLCSLRPVIAHIILETLKACELYATTIQSVIQFPPPIAPGFATFIRSDFSGELLKNEEILSKCLW